MTKPLFREDAYLKEAPAKVEAINELGGIILDASIFYPTGGGQPGDAGQLDFDGLPSHVDDRGGELLRPCRATPEKHQ